MFFLCKTENIPITTRLLNFIEFSKKKKSLGENLNLMGTLEVRAATLNSHAVFANLSLFLAHSTSSQVVCLE